MPRLRDVLVLLLLASAALTAPPGLSAQGEDDLAAEGGIFLLLPIGPKAVGMGRAVTALPGPEAVWWNPAGLAAVSGERALVYRGEELGGDATAISVQYSRAGVGAVALSYQLLDLGSTQFTDPQGNVTGEVTLRDHLAVLSVASDAWSSVHLGINLKLVQESFGCRGQCVGATGTTFAVDAGVQAVDVAGLPLRLGAVLAHAGPDLQLENRDQADPLPTRVRVAAAYDLLDALETEGVDLWTAVEVEDRWRDPGDPSVFIGTEFAAGRNTPVALLLRAGYVFGAELRTDGAAVGLGLEVDQFELGIAKSLASSGLATESEPVHVSFGFVF